MSRYKTERNEAIYDLRTKAPKKYSINRLGRVFDVSKITIYNAFIREERRRKSLKSSKKRG